MPASRGEPCLEKVQPFTSIGDRCVCDGATVVPLAAIGFEQAKVRRLIVTKPNMREEVGRMTRRQSNVRVLHVNFRIVRL